MTRARRAQGDVFFAMPGEKADGHNFIAERSSAAPSAVVCSRYRQLAAGAASVRVQDVRRDDGSMGRPFLSTGRASLKLVGVTGTNGKTTLTYLIESMLQRRGLAAGSDRHHQLSVRRQGNAFASHHARVARLAALLAEMAQARA